MQTEQFHVILYTLFPCLPTPALTPDTTKENLYESVAGAKKTEPIVGKPEDFGVVKSGNYSLSHSDFNQIFHAANPGSIEKFRVTSKWFLNQKRFSNPLDSRFLNPAFVLSDSDTGSQSFRSQVIPEPLESDLRSES